MPETEPDRSERPKQGRDAYDKANITILTFTLLAAFTAAGFTGWQAWIARDQEHRALRAYIVVSVELVDSRGETGTFIRFTAENMGQTPVYDLSFEVTNERLAEYEQPSSFAQTNLRRDCSIKNNSERIYNWTHTFSKEYRYDIGISSFGFTKRTAAETFAGSHRVLTRGTVCYRDIFREVHAYRLCYDWHGPSNPIRCAHDTDDSQTD